MLQDKILLSPKDVVELMNWGLNTVYNLFNSKDFPSFSVGRKKYVHVDKFNEWLLAQSDKR